MNVKMFSMVLALLIYVIEYAYAQDNKDYFYCHSLMLTYSFPEISPFFCIGKNAVLTFNYGLTRNEVPYIGKKGVDSVTYDTTDFSRVDTFHLRFDQENRLISVSSYIKKVNIHYFNDSIVYRWFAREEDSFIPNYLNSITVNESGYPQRRFFIERVISR